MINTFIFTLLHYEHAEAQRKILLTIQGFIKCNRHMHNYNFLF